MSQPEPICPDRRPLETRKQRWPSWLARRLSDAGASPNGVSVAGLAAGLAAAGAMVVSARVDTTAGRVVALGLAAGLVQLRLLCNMLDGLIAVECGKGGPTGDFFNEVPDRVEDALILGALGVAAGYPLHGAWVAWLALATAYVRAYRVSRGLGQDFCGPGAKPHRMFVVTVGLLAAAGLVGAGDLDRGTQALALALATVGVLSLITVVRRGYRVLRDLGRKAA